MGVVGIGVDLCEVERFETAVRRTPRLACRLLNGSERGLSVQSQAARFAAKEALAKALGSPGGLRWLDTEVVKDSAGAPQFKLTGTVAARVRELGIEAVHLSISHDGGFVTAMVVCES